MSALNKKMLKKQLDQQGDRLVSESNDYELTSSLLNTCAALLRSADKVMPIDLSEEEVENLFSVYLSISGRVAQFCRDHSSILEAASVDLQKKREIVIRNIQDMKHQVDQIRSEMADLKNEQASLNAEKTVTWNQCLDEKVKLDNAKAEIVRLREQLAARKTEITNFAADIERLVAECKKADEQYHELCSYYEELGRIRKGIEEEGYADIASFNEMLAERSAQAEEIMNDFDRILRNLSSDLLALQHKIELRRLKSCNKKQ